MGPREFTELADLVRRRAGLVLTPDKKILARSRLSPVARRFGFRDVAKLLAELPHPREEVARAIVDALMTYETSFFRDRGTFDFLAQSLLPALRSSRKSPRRLRIWCAAVSTGQEAYSLAMLLDGVPARDWRVELMATDISEEAIERAETGLYSEFEIERGLSPELRARYLLREGEQWRMADRLRRMVTFRPFNLLDHFGWLGKLDIIVCRNVLYYIDARERALIHAKLASALADDGYLLLGENEIITEQFVASDALPGLFVKPYNLQRGLRRLAG